MRARLGTCDVESTGTVTKNILLSRLRLRLFRGFSRRALHFARRSRRNVMSNKDDRPCGVSSASSGSEEPACDEGFAGLFCQLERFRRASFQVRWSSPHGRRSRREAILSSTR